MRAPASLRSPLHRASWLVALEGLLLVLAGLVYAAAGLLGDAESVAGAELGGLLILGSGVLLVLLSRALAGARGWARSPAVVVQLLTLLTAVSVLPTGVWPGAVAAIVVAALVLYQLATPQARAAFRQSPDAG